MNHQLRIAKMLALFWISTYTTMVYALAANPNISFAVDIRTFDYESLMWAACAALMGGLAHTIVSLASDKVIVLFIWREVLKDAAVAMIGGGLVFLAVQALASIWPQYFTREIRMLAVVAAGYGKGSWREWLSKLGGAGLERARSVVAGNTPQPATSPPSSVTAPLTDK